MIFLLLITFLQIGLVGFGGGYAILPLIQNYCVNSHGWISLDDFVNLVTISQITPGSILLHTATFVGYKVAGLPGALVATLASIVPSVIIIVMLSIIYYRNQGLPFVERLLRYLKPIVIGLVASASVAILVMALFRNALITWDNLSTISVALLLSALLALWRFKLNPILVIVGSGLLSLALYLVGVPL